MSAAHPSVDRAVSAATACAFAMIANQMAGKAVRDALFLSTFDAAMLPRMVIGAALLTIGAVLVASKLLASFGPRLVPGAFALSSLLLLGIWGLREIDPRIAAVALYLQISSLGAVLVSWFWSLVTERFDPRTARNRIGRIASGGTLGGLIGGGVAAAGSAFPIDWLLPVLAVFHAACALLTLRIGAGDTAPHEDEEEGRSGVQVLAQVPYLRNLALLVLVGTVSAAFLDFTFKFHAAATYEHERGLLLFFALFYTGVALVTFLVQSTLTRRALENLGLAYTVSILPFAVAIGSIAALFVPGLGSVGALRGSESAIRSSLFRSSYELFFTPILKSEKRASKTIVDVGFDRLGDAFGGGIVQLVLLAGGAATQILLGMAAALSVVALGIARLLHRGYIGALEKKLIRHGGGLETPPPDDEPTRTGFFRTVSQLELTGDLPDLGDDIGIATASFDRSQIEALIREREPGTPTSPVPEAEATPPAPTAPVSDRRPKRRPNSAQLPRLDPLLVRSMDLRSGDPMRVKKALQGTRELAPELVALTIPLLAWDVVAPLAIRALRRVCDRHPGQLLDALLDPDEEFAIRRRLPRVLSHSKSERTIQGLLQALRDRRFEVRYQCGVALARLHERSPQLPIDREAVLQTVNREAKVDRRVWESQRLLDDQSSRESSPFYDEVLRERSSRSLEHVFTMLSLVYPKQPLQIAYRGLHTDDRTLRGTALEYLESILPPALQESLWPFLDEREKPHVPTKSRDEILDSLLRSHESIQIDLDEIRKRARE